MLRPRTQKIQVVNDGIDRPQIQRRDIGISQSFAPRREVVKHKVETSLQQKQITSLEQKSIVPNRNVPVVTNSIPQRIPLQCSMPIAPLVRVQGIPREMCLLHKPLNLRLQILCQDDASEAKAQRVFGPQKWAFIKRLDQSKMHSGIYENIMYLEEFDICKSEWSSFDFVGTLSWKAADKIRKWQMFVEMMQSQILGIHCLHKYDAVFFFNAPGSNLFANNHPNFRPIWTDIVQSQCGIQSKLVSQCNFWMARPEVLQSQIRFFQKIFWPRLQKHPLLFTDAKYVSRHSIANIQSMNGKPQFVHTPFVCERLARNFFQDCGQSIGVL